MERKARKFHVATASSLASPFQKGLTFRDLSEICRGGWSLAQPFLNERRKVSRFKPPSLQPPRGSRRAWDSSSSKNSSLDMLSWVSAFSLKIWQKERVLWEGGSVMRCVIQYTYTLSSDDCHILFLSTTTSLSSLTCSGHLHLQHQQLRIKSHYVDKP